MSETAWAGPTHSGLLIVPDSLDRAITKKIDAAVSLHPSLESARESLRHDLIAIFHEHGTLDVEITPKSEDAA